MSGKAGECRWWPRRYQEDPWSRGREVARGVLRSSPKPVKRPTWYFLPSQRDREILSPFFYTAAPKCICIRRLAGARHLSPVVLWTLWPEGGSEPLTRAPRSDFMAQSLRLSIDVCPGLGISPLRTNIWLSFSQADRPRNYFFRGFWKVWNFFSKICAHSERYRHLLAGIFEILTFYRNIAFPLSPVLDPEILHTCLMCTCRAFYWWVFSSFFFPAKMWGLLRPKYPKKNRNPSIWRKKTFVERSAGAH